MCVLVCLLVHELPASPENNSLAAPAGGIQMHAPDSEAFLVLHSFLLQKMGNSAKHVFSSSVLLTYYRLLFVW